MIGERGNIKSDDQRSAVAGHKKQWYDVERFVLHVEDSFVRRERNREHCPSNGFD